MSEKTRLRGALEAILMVADEPVAPARLADATGVDQRLVIDTLEDLAHEYASELRGFVLRESGGGWRIYSAPEYADVVASFVTWGMSGRLSGPALETLAVIAYRQPVTRSEIAEIRGVAVDGVVRTLLTRGLIEAVGQEDSGALRYATTDYFLERMGMASLQELPHAAPHLPELDQLDDVERDQS